MPLSHTNGKKNGKKNEKRGARPFKRLRVHTQAGGNSHQRFYIHVQGLNKLLPMQYR